MRGLFTQTARDRPKTVKKCSRARKGRFLLGLIPPCEAIYTGVMEHQISVAFNDPLASRAVISRSNHPELKENDVVYITEESLAQPHPEHGEPHATFFLLHKKTGRRFRLWRDLEQSATALGRDYEVTDI